MPWLHQERKDKPNHLDCKTCMEYAAPEIRQSLACGYEPQIDDAHAWRPEGFDPDADIQWCAGYTSQLPEVVEVSRAFLHWDKGQLQLRYDDPPAALLDGIEILNGSISASNAYAMKKASERRG